MSAETAGHHDWQRPGGGEIHPTDEQIEDKYRLKSLAHEFCFSVIEFDNLGRTVAKERQTIPIEIDGQRMAALVYATDQQFYKTPFEDEFVDRFSPYALVKASPGMYQNATLVVGTEIEVLPSNNQSQASEPGLFLRGTSAQWTVDLPSREHRPYTPVWRYSLKQSDQLISSDEAKDFPPVFELVPWEDLPRAISPHVMQFLEHDISRILEDEQIVARTGGNTCDSQYSYMMEIMSRGMGESFTNILERLGMAVKVSKKDGSEIEFERLVEDEAYEVHVHDGQFVSDSAFFATDVSIDELFYERQKRRLFVHLSAGALSLDLDPRTAKEYEFTLVWKDDLEGEFAETLVNDDRKNPARSVI